LRWPERNSASNAKNIGSRSVDVRDTRKMSETRNGVRSLNMAKQRWTIFEKDISSIRVLGNSQVDLAKRLAHLVVLSHWTQPTKVKVVGTCHCRPPRIPANLEERTAGRSLPPTFVGCVSLIQETGTHHFYALPLDEGHLKKQIKDMHSELHLFWRRDTADKTRWIPCVCDCRF
jgi:hypothetical protein